MKIELSGVSLSYGDVRVIPPLSAVFEDHSFTTLLGPSGCGKTSLLRTIAGLETPDSGEIRFDSKLVFSKEKGINVPAEDRGIGFVFQDFALWPHLSVFENVAFALRARGDLEHLRSRVMDALAAVGLADFADRSVSALSGGQQQRVGFSRAIVSRPSVILFDEPLSALDAQLRESMRFEIKSIARRLGTTSIYVTHDQLEAMSMSDRVMVLSHGRIVEEAPPEALYEHPKSRFAAEFVGKSNFIDANTFFRPEKARLINPLEAERAGSEETLTFKARATAAAFAGSRWLIEAESDGRLWQLESARPTSVGAELTVNVRRSDLVRVE